jgi:hypothetical protein
MGLWPQTVNEDACAPAMHLTQHGSVPGAVTSEGRIERAVAHKRGQQQNDSRKKEYDCPSELQICQEGEGSESSADRRAQRPLITADVSAHT